MTPRLPILLLAAAVLAGCSEEDPRPAAPPAGPQLFVSAERTAWLMSRGAVIVDARSEVQFLEGHIPAAQPVRVVDLGLVPGQGVDHEKLRETSRRLGIRRGLPVVVYGDFERGQGQEGAVAWLLRAAGHDRVYVLGGGLGAWRLSGGRVVEPMKRTVKTVVPPPGSFRPRSRLDGWVDDLTMLDAAAKGAATIIDVRESYETGATADRRLPFGSLFDGGKLVKRERLLQHRALEGLPRDARIIVTDGSGTRSGFATLVLMTAGFENVSNHVAGEPHAKR